MSNTKILGGLICVGVCTLAGIARTAEPAAAKLVFSCEADNDLYKVLDPEGTRYRRYATAGEAIRAAEPGTGVLVLADGYPEKTTAIRSEDFEEAAKKKLRLYVEYPARLPGVELGKPWATHSERNAATSESFSFGRGVVTSAFFGKLLPPMRIVMIHGCHFLSTIDPCIINDRGPNERGRGPVPRRNLLDPRIDYAKINKAEKSHLVVAKVAGMDTAVFGLKDTESWPLLFEHPRGDMMIATTKLSQFVTARYAPSEAWEVIWKSILGWLQPDARVPELKWAPTVRPSFGPAERLPADVELQAVKRSAGWLLNSRILRHADWPKQALDLSLAYDTVRPMPAAKWPTGDGSLGVLEGFSSRINCDGSQPMRYGVRDDCMSEVAMELALNARVNRDGRSAKIAGNVLDFTLFTSPLTQGPRADPKSPSYGLIGWSLDGTRSATQDFSGPGTYYGDDNARAMLGVLAASALLDDTRWDESMIRCLLANLRTTSASGCREWCIKEKALQAKGWESYWTGRSACTSPHMQAWLSACFFWAYDKTGYEPFLVRGRAGVEGLVSAYPDRWRWILRSAQIERARIILPLAWLVRVDDTPEHRRWLRRFATDLLKYQDPCGAIRETLGGTEEGVASNEAFGKGESSLIQRGGDPVCDMLYTCNFALIGLHEAAAATGDPFYAEAEDKLAKFLCRIQVRSEAHPELDGAWYRAFDFRRWEYWASNADWEWGPWCTETGWTQPWIAGTLALRQMKTSLWDLTAKSKINTHFDKYRKQMMPDDVIRALDEKVKASLLTHDGLAKPVKLAVAVDERYPGGSLTDGLVSPADGPHGQWFGFYGVDLDAVVDLGRKMPIRRLGAHFLQSTSVGIFLPTSVEFAVSSNGKDFQPAAKVKPKAPPRKPGPLAETISVDGLDVTARYVRVRAANIGRIPAWHGAKGLKAWLFVDELLVNPAR